MELTGQASSASTGEWALNLSNEDFTFTYNANDLVITRDSVASDSVTLIGYDFANGALGFNVEAEPNQTLNGTLTGTYAESVITSLDLGTHQFLDWNNDGQMDVVSQDGASGNDLVWFNGKTMASTVIAANTDFGDYEIADWDGDGQLDIIANGASGGFGWYNLYHHLFGEA